MSSKGKGTNMPPAKKNDPSKGLDEIDALFANKKESKKVAAAERKKNQEKMDKETVGKRKRDDDRSCLEGLKEDEWIDDGLGGVYNREGFTGRREKESGLKVFKAHLFNKKGFGKSKDCPFDCDCCFI